MSAGDIWWILQSDGVYLPPMAEFSTHQVWASIVEVADQRCGSKVLCACNSGIFKPADGYLWWAMPFWVFLACGIPEAADRYKYCKWNVAQVVIEAKIWDVGRIKQRYWEWLQYSFEEVLVSHPASQERETVHHQHCMGTVYCRSWLRTWWVCR